MSRKGSTPQRTVLPDPKHGSETIARFINMVMQSGKKSVAEKIVYGAMDVIGEKNPNAIELVQKALDNVAPTVEVKSRRTPEEAFETVSAVQQARLWQAGLALQAQKPALQKLDLNVDLYILAPGRWPHHRINAFEAPPF